LARIAQSYGASQLAQTIRTHPYYESGDASRPPEHRPSSCPRPSDQIRNAIGALNTLLQMRSLADISLAQPTSGTIGT
ncbi:hypothetical protein AAHH80_40245, partial [Burkholderia pseudomallei]